MKKIWERVGAVWGHEKERAFLKGSAGSFILRVGGVLLRFVAGVLLARLLGVGAYGQYAYAVTWLVVLAIPAMLGMDHILIRFISSYSEHNQWGRLHALLRFSRKISLGSALSVSAVAILFLFWKAEMAVEARLTLGITMVAVPMVVLSQVQQAILRGVQRTSLAQLPEQIIYPGVLLILLGGIWFLSTGLSSPVAAGVNVVSWLFAALMGSYWVYRHVPLTVQTATPLPEKSQWISMVPDLVFFNLAYQLMSRTPTLALGILGSSRDVGVYSACTRGAEFVEFIYGAVTLAGAPLFARLYARGDKRELQRFTSLISIIIFGASLPVVAGLFLFVPQFLGLYGVEFVAGAGIMRLLLVAFFLNSLCGFVDVMLIVTGHQRLIVKVMGILALLNMGLCWALIPRFGLLGAAVASSFCVITLKITLVWWVYKKIGIISLPLTPRLISRLSLSPEAAH